jgi:URI fold toxin 2
MSIHGNAHDNNSPYHLYGIFEHRTDSLLKYGISGGRIGPDGMSKRMRAQLSFANIAAGFNKFFAKVLIGNIPGRLEAERIEREHIDAYRDRYGSAPPGNLR